MGAQDDRRQQGWYELPFWRMVKYVVISFLAGILAGVALTLIGFYTNYYQIALMRVGDFLVVNWWFAPTVTTFLGVVVYFTRFHGKKKEVQTRTKSSQS
jgi:NADH:ubiquinone oxidoreductase subunit 5 (subunit L)/multisubunit Na+/H+ antiporter MnhA subunit